jgi:hypothetical protein
MRKYTRGQRVRIISTGEVGIVDYVGDDSRAVRPYCVRLDGRTPWHAEDELEAIEVARTLLYEDLPRSEAVQYQMAVEAAWADLAMAEARHGRVATPAQIIQAVLSALPAIFPIEKELQ